ncbi:hypothetical protein IFR05_012435 [Cadophora sp. M221]|nr:hypothetical protein IFR05_012435 [Cadophora sp. M221]
MWPNHGFRGNFQFQNNFNSQDDYSPVLFGAGIGPSDPGQYFPQQPLNPSMMQYDENGTVVGEFEPEVGLYNEGPLYPNQFISRNPQFYPSPLHTQSVNDAFRASTRVGRRERSVLPGLQAYDSRPPARTRSYESQNFRDSDEPERTSRPFEVHGSYRGGAYDPNYRGRGRGRGRGDFQSHYDSVLRFLAQSHSKTREVSAEVEKAVSEKASLNLHY